MIIPEITAEDAAALVEAGAFLLDVREEDEWVAGRAPNAEWISLGGLQARVDDVPSDRRIVCICRSGARSAKAAGLLIAAGRDALNLVGGMRAWAEAGLTVTAESGRPGAVI
jgi:rhodanese-related sulfurtransferase